MSSERQTRRLSYDYTLGGVPCGIRPQTLLPKKGSGRATGGRNGSCLATPFLSGRNAMCMNATDFTSLNLALLCSAWNFPPRRHAMDIFHARNNGMHRIPPEIHLPLDLRISSINLLITYTPTFTYNKQQHPYSKKREKNTRELLNNQRYLIQFIPSLQTGCSMT